MAHGRHRAAAAAYQSQMGILREQESAAERQRLTAAGERQARLKELQPVRAYEETRLARGKEALAGRYNVAQDPRFMGIRRGLERTEVQRAAELERQATTGLGGFSARYLSEKLKESGAETTLNLAAALQGGQEEMIAAGGQAGQNIVGMLAPEAAGEMAERRGYTGQILGGYGTTQGIVGAAPAQAEAGALTRRGQNISMLTQAAQCACHIFLAGNNFLRAVHMYRDEFYPKGGFIHLGYVLMSLWLVPLMLRYRFLKNIVILIMLKPLAEYAMAHYMGNTFKKILFSPFKFWVLIWSLYGRIALVWNKLALKLGV